MLVDRRGMRRVAHIKSEKIQWMLPNTKKKLNRDMDSLEVITNTITEKVALYYHIDHSRIFRRNQSGRAADAHSIAIYLVRHILNITYQEVADRFGLDDHSTIMHHCTKVERSIEYYDDLITILKSLGAEEPPDDILPQNMPRELPVTRKAFLAVLTYWPDTTMNELRGVRQNELKTPARRVLAYLLRYELGLECTEISRHMGGTPNDMGILAKSVENFQRDDRNFARRVDQARLFLLS